MPTPMPSPYRTRALLCAVCDIRGFSLLTSRAHEFANRTFPRSELARSAKLKHAYQVYVERTQALAKKTLLKRLVQQNGTPHTDEYALKATGDGYLVALAFDTPFLDGGARNERYDDSESELKRAALNLLAGVRQLVDDAAVDSGQLFGNLTRDFIREWGDWIGIHESWLGKEGPELRVAGSLTLGTGIIYPGSSEVLPPDLTRSLAAAVRRVRESLGTFALKPKASKALAELETLATSSPVAERSVSYGDAFGDSVNLAFRLCGEAGRNLSHGGGKATPYILMDRRFTGLVYHSLRTLEAEKREEILGGGWEPRPFGRLVSLKGIEESWCYALVKSGAIERVAFVNEAEIFSC